MTEKQIAKELKRLIVTLSKEKQFNKKIDANRALKQFEKQYNIWIENISNIIYFYYYKGQKILKRSPKYSTRKINLEYKEIGTRLEILI